jgi:hypothetical protein
MFNSKLFLRRDEMATTDNAVKYDVRMLEEILPHLNVSANDTANLRNLVTKGWLQMDRMVEEAMANLGNFEMVSIHGMDFSDQSDAKSAVSNLRNNNKKRGMWTHSFEIRNIAVKVGALRVIGYNKILDKFHYFYIPHHAYAHLKKSKSSAVSICIEQYTKYGEEPEWTGIPKTSRMFWEYECATFEEMCLKG